MSIVKVNRSHIFCGWLTAGVCGAKTGKGGAQLYAFMDFIRGALAGGFEVDAPVKIQAAVKLALCVPCISKGSGRNRGRRRVAPCWLGTCGFSVSQTRFRCPVHDVVLRVPSSLFCPASARSRLTWLRRSSLPHPGSRCHQLVRCSWHRKAAQSLVAC